MWSSVYEYEHQYQYQHYDMLAIFSGTTCMRWEEWLTLHTLRQHPNTPTSTSTHTVVADVHGLLVLQEGALAV